MDKRALIVIFLGALLLSLTQASLIETAISLDHSTYHEGDNFDDNVLDAKWVKHNAQATGMTIYDDISIKEDIVEQNQKIELVVNGTGGTGKGYMSVGRWVNRTSLLETDIDFYYNFYTTGYIMLSGFDSRDDSMSWRMFMYDSWTSSLAAYQFSAYDSNVQQIYFYDTGFNGFPDQEGILHIKGEFNGNSSMTITASGEINHVASVTGDLYYWDYLMITFGINHDTNNAGSYTRADDYVELHEFDGVVNTYNETITLTETDTDYITNTVNETDTQTETATVIEDITNTEIVTINSTNIEISYQNETLYQIETMEITNIVDITNGKAEAALSGLTLVSIFAISTLTILYSKKKQ